MRTWQQLMERIWRMDLHTALAHRAAPLCAALRRDDTHAQRAADGGDPGPDGAQAEDESGTAFEYEHGHRRLNVAASKRKATMAPVMPAEALVCWYEPLGRGEEETNRHLSGHRRVVVKIVQCDAILCTHTGLQWHRRLPSGRDAVNVGVLGRPANDGRTNVWYALLEERELPSGKSDLDVELVPLAYDHQGLAEEMRREELPEEFVETILTGWWTTCLEILPSRERAESHY